MKKKIQCKSAIENGNGVYEKLSNTFLSGDYKLKDGEFHVPQLNFNLKKGIHVSRAVYSGPGSNNIEKYLNPEKFNKNLTQEDESALAHDIRYSMANGENDIRKADILMRNALLKKMRPWAPITSINNLFGAIGMQAKITGENIGLFKKDQFTSGGDFKDEPTEVEEAMKDRLQEEIEKGYTGIKTRKKRTSKKKK